MSSAMWLVVTVSESTNIEHIDYQKVLLNSTNVEQGSTFLSFCKGPDSNYLEFAAIWSCGNYSTSPVQPESSYRQCINEWVWLCSINLYLQTLEI